MIIKEKLLSVLHYLRAVFFPSTYEIMEDVEHPKEPGFFGKIFICLYFPNLNENMKMEECPKLILNRAIVIAFSMGSLCLCSKYFFSGFLEGVFFLLTLTSWFPYMIYLIVKKHLDIKPR